MTTLHLVRQSAFATNDFAQCLSVLAHKDAIVFIDDGCYNVKHPLLSSLIERVDDSVSLNVVDSHAKARAIEAPKSIHKVSITEVVELTFIHKKVITWQ